MALLVGRLQRFRHLFGNGQDLIDGNRPFSDPIRERRPCDEFHNEGRLPIRSRDTEDRRDVGMAERSQDLGFALEPRETLRVGRHGLREHFHGHLTLQVGVSGAVDLAHAANADLRGDFVGTDSSATAKRF